MNIKHTVPVATLTAILLLLISLHTQAHASSQISIHVDHKPIPLTDPIIMQNGRILIPMRTLGEALGAAVHWDAGTKTALGWRNGIKIRIPVGSKNLTVNGTVKPMEVPAQLINGRIYIPLRFLSEALGDLVLWEEATGKIKITRSANLKTSVCPGSARAPFPLVPSSNPIENPSVEIAAIGNKDMPAAWDNSSWGNHQAVFTFLKEGHSGSRSIKITVTDYIDGDAKWFFRPVSLIPGADYIFSNYYRSNVDTRVVMAVTDDPGATTYLELPVAPASKDWRHYRASFSMPEHGKSVTIYHLLAQNGYLLTDDYAIEPYRYEGFRQGLVTITFDDAWEENTETALPVMQEFGFKSNQFYTTSHIENPWLPNPETLIKKFIADGHEIGSHSVTHPDLTALTVEELSKELMDSRLFLENLLGIEVKYFAAPYGAYNALVNQNIMQHYAAHRTVDIGFNAKDNLNVGSLKVQNVLSTTSAQEVATWVKKAREEKLWLILVYHRVTDNPGIYDTTPELFRQHLQAIKDAALQVVTISEALAELYAQL